MAALGILSQGDQSEARKFEGRQGGGTERRALRGLRKILYSSSTEVVLSFVFGRKTTYLPINVRSAFDHKRWVACYEKTSIALRKYLYTEKIDEN